jgi:hypothetical protein
MNSDELTEVSPFTDSQRDIEPPPPPTGRGRGRGDDRKKIVYKLTRPPIQLLYSQPLHRPGEPTLGEGAQDEGAPRRGGGGNLQGIESRTLSREKGNHAVRDTGRTCVEPSV